MAPTDESTLSERQREVLALVREGKNPTEIGNALEITSQAVHGHLRRLRGHGLLADEPTAPGRAAARRRRELNGRFDPDDALAAVRAAAERGIADAEARKVEIDVEIGRLKEEQAKLTDAVAELRKHVPSD